MSDLPENQKQPAKEAFSIDQEASPESKIIPETVETLTQEGLPNKASSDNEDVQKDKKEQIESLVQEKNIPNVVDRSEEPLVLHSIKKGDKLTTLADKEEEEFIEKVEAAHEQSN